MRVDMLDYTNLPDPSPVHLDSIIDKIGKKAVNIAFTGVIPMISSEQDLRNEVSFFWKKVNKGMEYEAVHPIADEVPETVKPILAQRPLPVPDKGTIFKLIFNFLYLFS